MGCGCGKNKQQYEVVAGGRVIYTTTSKPAAEGVSQRHPGSEVRPKAAANAG
ncbi:hypothetical protein [Microtetraspora malaysiensis]|uniref:Uncharacterized protein n=1 Tax=Microtetraspora malaysiensis TaxID=161358 RepID=A0ABW6SN76_9ACTN